YLYPEDPDIIAIACDAELPEPVNISVLDINDIEGIAALIVARINSS
ncbi:MAG: molybdopterin-guanine dinucleotide biosynthesis protein MobB, partial [Gammaproteobacteria bacterium]|nr:molybdopterin-guanine dinucleotide biosynthesis protein MobB [Gammaproteobacteria bacterium]